LVLKYTQLQTEEGGTRMTFTYIAIGIALFFAMNIGASGAAATMGAAYGGGAITKKWALLVAALGVFLGAAIGGGEVVKTIGHGIIPGGVLTVEIVVIILFSATFTLFLANLLGIPLSTSEVTIGSIVGVGIAFQSLFINKLFYIISFWIAVPIIAYVASFIAGKLIIIAEKRWPQLKGSGRWGKWLAGLLILTGFIEAFSAGMNNVANAVGPLVGAGMINISTGTLVGGLFVALGAIIFGGRVLDTNGKKITRLSLLQGSAVSTTGGTLVIIASVFGIPVPLTQVTTSAILGVGTAKNGFRLWQKDVIKQIIKVWVVSPIVSLVVSFSLIKTVIEPNPYTLVVILSVLISTIGMMSLYQTVTKEKRAIHEQGGGI
jgi:sulfate permease